MVIWCLDHHLDAEDDVDQSQLYAVPASGQQRVS